MARSRGTFNFAADFEVLNKAPLDARLVIDDKNNLIDPSTWEDSEGFNNLYKGIIVSVVNDNENNGVYFLNDLDDYININSWKRIGDLDSTVWNGLSITNNAIGLGGDLTTDVSLDLTNNALSLKNTILAFDSGSGFNQLTQDVAVTIDGNILVGGDFTSYNGNPISRFIQLTNSGVKDSNFIIGTGFDNTVMTFEIQPDNKILIGGEFNNYNNTVANRIIRLLPTGAIDLTFNYGTGFNGIVRTINYTAADKILVGGDFTTYNGNTALGIIRLNSNGSIDSTFDSGSGFIGNVYSIDIQTNNKIVVGGEFNSYDGSTANNIIRLDDSGLIDLTFDNGIGFNDIVKNLKVLSDSTIIIAGNFTSYDGSTYNRIIKLDYYGNVDENFNLEGVGFDESINDFKIQDDNKIVVIGKFTNYNGISANKIIRLNTDGTIDNSFVYNNGFPGTSFYANKVAIQSNGKLLVAGNFDYYNGESANNIIRISSNGSIDQGDNFEILKIEGNTANYGANFHDSYTPRSLVDREYVDNVVGNSIKGYSGTFIGDGITTSFDIHHNLDTLNQSITVYESNGLTTYPDLERGLNTDTILFYTPPAVGVELSIVILGFTTTTGKGYEETIYGDDITTSFSVNHNLGTVFQTITVYDQNDSIVYPDLQRGSNVDIITFFAPPVIGENYSIVIIGF